MSLFLLFFGSERREEGVKELKKKKRVERKFKAAPLSVILVSIFLLSSLAGTQIIGSVSAQWPYPWPMLDHNPQRTGYTESPAPETNQTLWVTDTPMMVSKPCVANFRVYIGA